MADQILRAKDSLGNIRDLATPVGAEYGVTVGGSILQGILDAIGGTIAATVSGEISLDAATLSALETVNAVVSGTVAISNFPATQTVAGTVALDATTLAALENITAVVSGTVALDATTLAALEQITAVISGTVTVAGTVELGATSLAALETINAIVSGTVSISGTVPVSGPLTDSELRASAVPISDGGGSVTVDGAVTVSNPTADPETGLAKEATIGTKFGGGKVTTALRINAAGDNIVIDPGAGQAVKLFWVGLSSPDANTAEVLAIVKFGTDVKYRWNMTAPGAFSHWEIIQGGVDENLVINLSGSQPVDVNVTYILV